MTLRGIARKSFGGIVAVTLTSGVYTFGQTRTAPVDPGVRGGPAGAGRCIMRPNQVQGVGIPAVDISKLSVANPRCILQHGLENGFEFACRGGDDPQHFGSRGLLLQRFA